MSRAGPIPAVLGLCAILVAESLAGECPYPAFEYELVGLNVPSLPDLRGDLQGLAIADVDGDGSSDAVASVAGTPNCVVTYRAEKPRCYVRARSVAVATTGDVVLLDVTGDGIRDAVVAGSLGLVVLVGDGAGGFEVRAHVPEVRGPIAQLASADPAIDIVACGENGTCVVLGRTPGSDALPFRRGDVIPDGRIDLGDPVRALRWLFLDSVPLACDDAADANDDGLVDIGDAIGILSYLFLGGGPPSAPFPECGVDATEDTFGCVAPVG